MANISSAVIAQLLQGLTLLNRGKFEKPCFSNFSYNVAARIPCVLGAGPGSLYTLSI